MVNNTMVRPLADVSLCAIVRDEVMNPAGGIVDFVHRTVPFVEEAVIVDTGSIDGTRELLEEMESKYSHLKIIDHKFDGYGPSRNVSLKNSDAKYALVLDADERLLREDFLELGLVLKDSSADSYVFGFLHLLPSGEDSSARAHCKRLFMRKNATYLGDIWENTDGTDFYDYERLSLEIKHFLPTEKGREVKINQWYDSGCYMKESPSKTHGYLAWKQPNQELLDKILGELPREAIV